MKITKKIIWNFHATANGELMRCVALLAIVPFAIFLITLNGIGFSQNTIRNFEDRNVGISLTYPSYWDDLESHIGEIHP